MKIGILTFHWATNYGAVLQAYALQTYLQSMGHDVYIINYKPRHFDYNLINYLKNRYFLNHRKFINSYRKEKVLEKFRAKYLVLSNRAYRSIELSDIVSEFDVVISGSDQVMNPSFLLNGDGRRKVSTAYFLDFQIAGKKIGYAVSFGCTKYPDSARGIAVNVINQIDKIGVRESTGLDILNSMGYTKENAIVPDPTILCYDRLYKSLDIPILHKTAYYCAYILHKQLEVNAENVIYIDEENNPLSMEEWIGTIAQSQGLITNSYHGMIMALLNNVPFVAITVSTGSIGMNDRFTTLFSRLGLEERLCDEKDDYLAILSKPIDWETVNERIAAYSEIGKQFLNI